MWVMRGYGVSNGSLPGCGGKIKIKILWIAIPEILCVVGFV